VILKFLNNSTGSRNYRRIEGGIIEVEVESAVVPEVSDPG
jgi:hypothetical protein